MSPQRDSGFLWPHLLSLPGPDALCLCVEEEVGRVCPCDPCWALGPGAAAGAAPGFLHLCEEDGLHADRGGDLLRPGALVWVDLCESDRCR